MKSFLPWIASLVTSGKILGPREDLSGPIFGLVDIELPGYLIFSPQAWGGSLIPSCLKNL